MPAFLRRIVFLTLSCCVLTGATAFSLAAQEATPVVDEVEVYGPDELVGGATLGEWQGRHWQWTVSFPIDINPAFDPTGSERCGFGQSGPVFFLPGSFLAEIPEEIVCVVPTDTAIMVIISGAECSTVEPPPYFGRDEADLRACAELAMDGFFDLSVTVDGQDIPDLDQYRLTTPMFTLNFPEDNVFFVEPGVANAVANGYQLILAPLPAGEHEIVVDITDDFGSFQLRYRVVVEEPQIIDPDATPVATPAATPVT